VLLGGDARHAGPRAARHGDGWTMMVGTPADFAAGIEVVRGLLDRGRPPWHSRDHGHLLRRAR
jgi:hypothetical protein